MHGCLESQGPITNAVAPTIARRRMEPTAGKNTDVRLDMSRCESDAEIVRQPRPVAKSASTISRTRTACYSTHARPRDHQAIRDHANGSLVSLDATVHGVNIRDADQRPLREFHGVLF